MAFNLPNFLGERPQDTALTNLLDTLRAPGMQSQAIEAQRRALEGQMQTTEGQKLQNELSRMKIDYPGITSSEPLVILHALNQIKKDREMGGNLPGLGQMQNFNLDGLETQRGQSGVPQNIEGLYDMLVRERKTEVKRKEQIANSNDWVNKTQMGKREEIAKANSIGIPIDEFERRRINGESIERIAQDYGMSIENLSKVRPLYLPSDATVTELQEVAGRTAYIESMNKFIDDALSGVSRRIYDFSPKQVASSLFGINKEQQAKILAARMLGPELSAIQLRQADAPSTKETIRDFNQKAMRNLSAFEALVAPDVFKRAAEIAREQSRKAIENRMSVLRGSSLSSVLKEKERESEVLKPKREGYTRIKLTDGRIVEIPSSRQAEFFAKFGGAQND